MQMANPVICNDPAWHKERKSQPTKRVWQIKAAAAAAAAAAQDLQMKGVRKYSKKVGHSEVLQSI